MRIYIFTDQNFTLEGHIGVLKYVATFQVILILLY